jgi:hypothetical protein
LSKRPKLQNGTLDSFIMRMWSMCEPTLLQLCFTTRVQLTFIGWGKNSAYLIEDTVVCSSKTQSLNFQPFFVELYVLLWLLLLQIYIELSWMVGIHFFLAGIRDLHWIAVLVAKDQKQWRSNKVSEGKRSVSLGGTSVGSAIWSCWPPSPSCTCVFQAADQHSKDAISHNSVAALNWMHTNSGLRWALACRATFAQRNPKHSWGLLTDPFFCCHFPRISGFLVLNRKLHSDFC